jgi:hypothetical protein
MEHKTNQENSTSRAKRAQFTPSSCNGRGTLPTTSWRFGRPARAGLLFRNRLKDINEEIENAAFDYRLL